MATLSNAVQAMIDELHAKMTSGQPLTPEEQMLVAKALESLQSHETWERALIAVAEEHLDTATNAMNLATTTMTTEVQQSADNVNSAAQAVVDATASVEYLPIIKPAPVANLWESAPVDHIVYLTRSIYVGTPWNENNRAYRLTGFEWFMYKIFWYTTSSLFVIRDNEGVVTSYDWDTLITEQLGANYNDYLICSCPAPDGLSVLFVVERRSTGAANKSSYAGSYEVWEFDFRTKNLAKKHTLDFGSSLGTFPKVDLMRLYHVSGHRDYNVTEWVNTPNHCEVLTTGKMRFSLYGAYLVEFDLTTGVVEKFVEPKVLGTGKMLRNPVYAIRYLTLDGKVALTEPCYNSDGFVRFTVMSGGHVRRIQVTHEEMNGIFANLSGNSMVVPVSDKVLECFNTNSTYHNPKLLDRASFDAFLVKLAEREGMVPFNILENGLTEYKDFGVLYCKSTDMITYSKTAPEPFQLGNFAEGSEFIVFDGEVNEHPSGQGWLNFGILHTDLDGTGADTAGIYLFTEDDVSEDMDPTLTNEYEFFFNMKTQSASSRGGTSIGTPGSALTSYGGMIVSYHPVNQVVKFWSYSYYYNTSGNASNGNPNAAQIILEAPWTHAKPPKIGLRGGVNVSVFPCSKPSVENKDTFSPGQGLEDDGSMWFRNNTRI